MFKTPNIHHHLWTSNITYNKYCNYARPKRARDRQADDPWLVAYKETTDDNEGQIE